MIANNKTVKTLADALVLYEDKVPAARQVIFSELDERRGAAMLDTAIASLPQRLR